MISTRKTEKKGIAMNLWRISGMMMAILFAVIFCTGCSSKQEEASQVEDSAMLICAKTGIEKSREMSVGRFVEYEACSLSLAYWGDVAKKREITELTEAFEAEYPGIEIELTQIPYDTREEMILQQLQNGTAPDINQIEWEWLHEYSADGSLFYDLYKEHKNVQLGEIGQENLNLCTVAEKLQALPAGLSGKVFFFNESLFEKAGIEVPKTWEELMAAGEFFCTNLGEEYYPLSLTIEDRMEFLVYYLQTTYQKDWVVSGVLQYYADEVQSGTEILLALEEAHVVPTLQYARSEETRSKDGGWSSACYGGVFVDSDACEAYETMLPAGNTGVVAERFKDMGTGNGGYIKVTEAYAISENCAHKKEAALFLDYLVNGDNTAEKCAGDEVALESDYYINYDYLEMIRDDSLYSDIMEGLSYGDYNAKEAAQLLMDSFGN